MNFYLDERQQKKRRRILRLKIYGGLAVFFLLITGAGYLAVYSPLFQIKDIKVNQINADGKQIDADNLVRDLKIFFSSQSKIASILGTDNILIWDNDKLIGFPKDSKISEIDIEKDYSGREVKINVKQREKFGIWCVEPPLLQASSTKQSTISQCWWFDKDGVILSDAPRVEGNLINEVSDFSGRNLNLGNLVLNEKFIPNLTEIFAFLDESASGIKSLVLKNIELQEMETASSPKIYFSLRFSPDFGLAAIESLRQLGLDKISYVDLRVKNRAYYKLK